MRGQQVVRTELLGFTTGHKVVYRGLGRLPRGRYILVLRTGPQHRRTVLRLAFRVR